MKTHSFFNKYKNIFILFILMNIIYTIVGVTAFLLLPHDQIFGQLTTTPITILDVFTRWDGMHYNSIAIDGYGVYNENNIAFFPLYPFIMRILYKLTGVMPVYWGLIVSRLSYLASMILLYDLTSLDYDEETSYTTVLYMTVFPASFYFISLYTEALFLLFILLSFTCFRKERYLCGAFFAMLSTALRSVGIFMIPVLLSEYLLKNKWEIKSLWKKIREDAKTGVAISLKPVFSLLIIPLGLLMFMFYCGLREGNILAFSSAQKAYMRFLKFPTVSLWVTAKNSVGFLWSVFKTFFIENAHIDSSLDLKLGFAFIKELLFGTFFTGIIVMMFKKVRPSYWLYTILMFIVPFSTAVGDEGLSGMPRYVLILFPVFVFMASMRKCKKFNYTYLSLSIVLGIVLMSLFSCWHWVA